jgi:hypothetical protein
VEEAVKNQHLRLASMAKENRTPEHIATVTFMDVEEFKLGADGMISKSQSKVGFKMGK